MSPHNDFKMNMPRKFNVNEFVLVQVYEKGFELWKQQDDAILPAEWHRPLESYKEKAVDGWVKIQLHEFMRRFGALTGMHASTIYNTTIYLDANKLQEPYS